MTSSLSLSVTVACRAVVCVCKWDLKRFLGNPWDGIRFELVEGKSRPKLLISPVDNTSRRFSSCQSDSVNLSPTRCVSVTANVFQRSPLLQGYQEVSLWEVLSSSAACLPATLASFYQPLIASVFSLISSAVCFSLMCVKEDNSFQLGLDVECVLQS